MDAEAALLAAIAIDPEDPMPYRVYGDWLLMRDDPRGELIALQATGDEHPGDHRISDAAAAHIRANRATYLGALQALWSPERETDLRLAWRCGFIGAAELELWVPEDGKPDPADALAALLELPSARFLTRLVIEPGLVRDGMELVAATLAAHAPLPLRRLHLGAVDLWSPLRAAELGALGAIWPAVPQLTHLVIAGRPRSLGLIDLPNLREASIQLDPGSGARAARVLHDVATARWPTLETLRIWHGHDPGAIAAVLARADLVTLGDVALINCGFADLACAVIAASPLAPQLHRLSLARGTLTDAGCRTLLRERAAFPSLATIDVSQTFVTDDGRAMLRELAREVVAHDRRRGARDVAIPAPPSRDDDDDDDAYDEA
ncbi:MAG: TIGR02996 domain-containing protein [Myxococcota bacterium]|nr:TIGR02996 domain-containing protein [Myxococcota bacterium]